MTGVRLEIDLSSLDAVKRKLSKLQDLGPLLDAIGGALETTTKERFQSGTAPDGTSWKPVRRGGKPLVDSSRLVQSISRQRSGNTVQVGTNVIYGAIHQFGGEIKPKKAKVLHFQIDGNSIFARKVTIPARPFLGIGPADEAAIEDAIQDEVDLTTGGA